MSFFPFMSLRSKVNHITITLLPKWHLGSIFIFILHTFSTLYLFSPMGYILGQNILATSDNDDFIVSLRKSKNFSVDTTSYWKNTWHACKPTWCLWLLHTICAETHHIITLAWYGAFRHLYKAKLEFWYISL